MSVDMAGLLYLKTHRGCSWLCKIAQDQDSPHSRMKREGTQQPPPLAGELLTVNDFWESQFSLKV